MCQQFQQVYSQLLKKLSGLFYVPASASNHRSQWFLCNQAEGILQCGAHSGCSPGLYMPSILFNLSEVCWLVGED